MAAGPIGPTWDAGSFEDTAWDEDAWGDSPDAVSVRRAINARRRRRCAIILYRRFNGSK